MHRKDAAIVRLRPSVRPAGRPAYSCHPSALKRGGINRRWWSFIAPCSGDHSVLAINLTYSRISRSIGHTWTVDAPRCHNLSDSLLGLRVRSFIVKPCPHAHVDACYKVACAFSMRLCSKLLCGRGLTGAAFYRISTDSVLKQSLSGSWASCLASLRPFIEILRSLVTA